MSEFDWTILLILLFHALVWPQSSSKSHLIQNLRSKMQPLCLALGLSHSWKMFCQTEWTHTARLKILVKNSSGEHSACIEPVGYMEQKWFSELVLMRAIPADLMREMLDYYRRNAFPDATEFVLVRSVGMRPKAPSGWFEKFDPSETEMKSRELAKLIRVGQAWKFQTQTRKS